MPCQETIQMAAAATTAGAASVRGSSGRQAAGDAQGLAAPDLGDAQRGVGGEGGEHGADRPGGRQEAGRELGQGRAAAARPWRRW